MDKVKITRELADYIEDCLKHTTAEALLKTHRFENRLPKVLNDMDFDRLAIAIFIGYEVEETPEDKVKTYFHSNGSFTEAQTNFKQIVVVDVLNRLGIKIESVNHE